MEFEMVCPCGVELRVTDPHVSVAELAETFNGHLHDESRAVTLAKYRIELFHTRTWPGDVP